MISIFKPKQEQVNHLQRIKDKIIQTTESFEKRIKEIEEFADSISEQNKQSIYSIMRRANSNERIPPLHSLDICKHI